MTTDNMIRKAVQQLTAFAPAALLLALLICFIYVGVMQHEFYFAQFKDVATSKATFIAIFIPVAIQTIRASTLLSSANAFSNNKFWSGTFIFLMSVGVAYFEHFEANSMATYWAATTGNDPEAYRLLLRFTIWITIPLEMALAFIYGAEAKKTEAEEKAEQEAAAAEQEKAEQSKIDELVEKANQRLQSKPAEKTLEGNLNGLSHS